MKLTLKDPKTGGYLMLLKGEEDFDRLFYSRDRNNKYFTIAWNYGEKQSVTIDGMAHDFMPHTILPLMFNHRSVLRTQRILLPGSLTASSIVSSIMMLR
jgi:AraC family transcriptional activator of pobA